MTESQKPALVDRFGRYVTYVRLSVTDRCDLRCNYCMLVGFKDYEEPKDWLTLSSMNHRLKLFALWPVPVVKRGSL